MAERHYTATITAGSRALIHRLIDEAQEGWRVEILRTKRSNLLNKKMWAMLQDISDQVIWYGERLSPEQWKDVCSASLRNCKVVPTIDGDGLVPLGLQTSVMGEEEFRVLLDLIEAFGGQERVIWTAPQWMQEQAEVQRTAKAKS
jgi:uncharacterized protein (UPF0248 family)